MEMWQDAMYGLGLFTFCNCLGMALRKIYQTARTSYRKFCAEEDAKEQDMERRRRFAARRKAALVDAVRPGTVRRAENGPTPTEPDKETGTAETVEASPAPATP